MVLYSAQVMKRLGIQATFGKSLKDICYIISQPLSSIYNIKVSKGMSNILVKYFNYSKKLCNAVNLKLKLNTVLQTFMFICSKKVQIQDKT